MLTAPTSGFWRLKTSTSNIQDIRGEARGRFTVSIWPTKSCESFITTTLRASLGCRHLNQNWNTPQPLSHEQALDKRSCMMTQHTSSSATTAEKNGRHITLCALIDALGWQILQGQSFLDDVLSYR